MKGAMKNPLVIIGAIIVIFIILGLIGATNTAGTSTNDQNSTSTNTNLQQTQAAQTTQYIPTPAENNQSCKVKAEITQFKALISSCYLEGQLTPECQTSFDKDGNYLDSNPQQPNELDIYMTKVNACLAKCYLAPSVQNPILQADKDAEALCDQIYPLSNTTNTN